MQDKLIQQRQALLELLYDARVGESRQRPGFIPQKDLQDALGECGFNLGVLEELKYIERKGYQLRITAQGVIIAEHGRDQANR